MRPTVRRLLLLAGVLLVGGCQPGILDPQGFVGASQRTILIDSLAIMLAIVVPTILATLAFAWWFRATNLRAKYLPDWEFSGQVEMVSWGIPVLTIMLLGGVTWVASHDLDPAVPIPSTTKPIEIQVVSLDWKWLFIYPEQRVASVNQLVVPAGVPMHFALTSSSVMNAFFVPQLGSMIYTMNGMATELNLIADNPGTFAGLSAHFSGDGFSGMHFDVRALPPAQFADWVKTAQGTGAALDAAAYSQLARQSQDVPPATFNSVDPELFTKIVSQQIPPAPGPTDGSEGIGGSNAVRP